MVLGVWDDFWGFEVFDLDNHNGRPLWLSRSKISDLQKSSQTPQKHDSNGFIRQNDLFYVHLNNFGLILDISGKNARGSN